MEESLKYYFTNNVSECVHFNKYTIDECGIIRNEKKEALMYKIGKDEYQIASVQDASGKSRCIRVARALASTFLGPPPSPVYTADHNDQIRANDILENIRWATKSEQRNNQNRADTKKNAFIIVCDGEEKTFKEWSKYFNSKSEKNLYGREYTGTMIQNYAQRKQHGFAYKEYPDLEGEVWKDVEGSKNKQGCMWRISNMCRVKYVTNHAENVLEGDRLGLSKGYPKIRFNGKDWSCHIVAFKTFYPDEYANKKPYEMVLHEEDDQMDFRPDMLRLGTQSQNITDAYNNGKYIGTLRERQRCVSYIKGVFEKEHESQHDAAKYLISKGYEKAHSGSIHRALSGKQKTSYGRTWALV